MAAVEVVIRGHRVADFDASDTGADGDDFAGDLMADDTRKFRRHAPGLDVLNGQARATRQHTGDGFAGAGFRIGKGFQDERRIRRLQHHGFHGRSPIST